MNRQLQDWKFTQLGGGEGTKDGEWLSVSQFPTTVHVELLKLKRIPDPFLALAEWDVQWVGESRWAFKTQFTVDAAEMKCSNADLVFEGIDTFATVLLNGNEILKANNQFVSYRVSAKPHLREGANELVLNFDSAFTVGREIEKKHGKLLLWNGDSSRLHVRKAQYNYGWDWGPVLMTIGPWKPVRFHSYENRITDLDVRTQVSESLDVKLDAKFTFEKKKGYASFVLKRPDGSEEVSAPKIPTDNGVGEVSFKFPSGHLQLWYPVGYGAQPLYTVQVELTDLARNVLDTQTQKIGIRRARVVQEKLIDQDGLSFLFEINNVRIFCGGSNWIPADSFLTTVTAERYRAWLDLLVKGNQNMIRVWGGGIYEADVFYDICDEFGVLVWQDFMFGCGQYPAYESFLESVQIEAEQNIKRLRSHPSIVIFAGNNEDYQLAESVKLELDYSDEKSDYLKTNFPARHIYERLLPAVVEKLSDTFYHRGSPYSGQGKVTTDPAYGDIRGFFPFTSPNVLTPAPWINGMFGMGRKNLGTTGTSWPDGSYPSLGCKASRTFAPWITGWMVINLKGILNQESITTTTKADGFERRLELYLVENFKHSFEMESYVYYTQIMQAETLASAYRLWRRNWAGKGREYTAGALVWQINDCWPVTSWAIVDYFLRPKPAYFAIARELRPYTVGMTRKEKKVFANDLSSAQFTIDTVLEIWGTNSTLVDHKVTVEVTSFDLQSDCWRDKWSKEVVLKANSSTEVHKGTLPGQPIRTKTSQVPKMIIVSARLIAESGEVLARYSNWPEPFKFINFPPDTAVKATVDGESVTLSANRPVKGIVLDVEGPEVQWSDQAIDLVPDDPQVVQAVGLNGREVKMRYLGDGTA
ncbi:Beta-mannosidase B [Mycena sanguinolenta]|uniref:Beta-mannosidase B n=1 Tax=Mycena sanguinolenta TaxID=230812 RepID=A0A8H7D1H4_9AGAR|nr:Beta-mannosidase B [Mycena sanguinolenta]